MGLEVIFLRFDFYIIHTNSDRQPNITRKSWKFYFHGNKKKK